LASKIGKPIADFAAPKRQLAEKKYLSAKPGDVSKYNIGKRMRLSALRSKQADTAKGSAYDRMLSENTDEDILAGKLDKKMGPEIVAKEKDAAAFRQKKREAELIESAAQNIKRTYGSTGTIGGGGTIGGAEKEFDAAYKANDRVRMIAAMNVMASSGQPGIEKLDRATSRINPTENPQLYSEYLNELNGISGLKSHNAALSKLSYTGGALSGVTNDLETYYNLTATEASTQTETVLRRIQATPGAMTTTTAQQILGSDILKNNLTPVTLQIITDIANGVAPSPTVTSTQTTTQTVEPGVIPANPGNQAATTPDDVWDRIAAARTSAQGMSGDTPLVVDHSAPLAGGAPEPKHPVDTRSPREAFEDMKRASEEVERRRNNPPS
jgi:hypothetical protein